MGSGLARRGSEVGLLSQQDFMVLSQETPVSKTRAGDYQSQHKQEGQSSPEQGQKPNWRLQAQAAKPQPSPWAEMQATRSHHF